MTHTQFIDAVRALKSFPPEVADAADKASAAMTPERRAEVLETLTQLHAQYGEIEEERIRLTDQAFAELRQMQKDAKADIQTQSNETDAERVEELSQRIDEQNT